MYLIVFFFFYKIFLRHLQADLFTYVMISYHYNFGDRHLYIRGNTSNSHDSPTDASNSVNLSRIFSFNSVIVLGLLVILIHPSFDEIPKEVYCR